MTVDFEELDYRRTPMGELSLRRRHDPRLGGAIFEVKLGDAFLMSSRFTAGEIALAEYALGAVRKTGIDVLVGGLGLGYTARAVLDRADVRSLIVIEALPDVIDWHRRALVPLGAALTADPRCRLVEGDFFALLNSPDASFAPDAVGRKFHAILVDIDHSPRNHLHPRHAAFYTTDGLRRLAGHLHPDGVFALWSNDPPDAEFLSILGEVFATGDAEVVGFDNPLQDRTATNTIYVAQASMRRPPKGAKPS